MSDQTFPQALALVLAHEGGYTNNPKDPGGETNRGVTRAVYDAYRHNKGLSAQSVLAISADELSDIYRNQYWAMVAADRLPAGLDYAVFDYAVNSGAERAIKDLQRVLGVAVDGQVGEATIAKACSVADETEIEETILALCERRMAFLKSLRTWGTFGKGWERRVEGDEDGFQEGDKGVVDFAVMIARKTGIPSKLLPAAIGAKEGEVAGKGHPSDVAITKTPQGKSVLATATGIGGTLVASAGSLVQQGQQAATVASKAGAAAQTVADSTVKLHDSAGKIFGVIDHTMIETVLGGSLVLSLAGCAFFAWHYIAGQREKAV